MWLPHQANVRAFVAISQACSFLVFNLNSMPYVQRSSLVHDVLVKNTSWDPAFADLLLQTGDFCQTLSVPNEHLDSGLLLVVQLYARLLSSSVCKWYGVVERFVGARSKDALC